MKNNWDKWKRMQCNIDKAIINEAATNLLLQHYQELHTQLVHTPEDWDVFQDAYLKITYKYNPDKDFIEQFKWLFNQLKGAYRRDDSCNHYYELDEGRVSIPDNIPDTPLPKDLDLVTKLKAICKL